MTSGFDSGSETTSRRRFLQASGAAVTTGLAGCIGGVGSGLEEVRIAYMPIYPDMQHFVMQEEGYLDDMSVSWTAEQFPDGPSIVQAYAKGDFEIALFGVVPAMIIIDKTDFAQITGANIKNAMKILASDEFTKMWEQYGKEAFEKFEEKNGRKFTFGTFPPGSVPDILLRYWLEQELNLDPKKAVNIKPLGGAGAVRQALLAEEIDGTSIMEPIPTIVESKDAPFQSIAWAGDFMPGQPAAVTMMHDRLHKENPKIAKEYMTQHIKATQFTNQNPNQAAKHASTVIGKEVLPVDIAEQAMRSKASDFISNPHEIEGGAKIFANYAHRLGKTKKELTVEEMFNYDIYDAVAKE